MFRTGWLLLLTLLAWRAESPVNTVLSQARTLLQAERYDEAVQPFERPLQLQPSPKRARGELAIAMLQELVRRRGSEPFHDELLHLGAAQFKNRKHESSVEGFRRPAHEIRSTDAGVNRLLAELRAHPAGGR